ncbi:unnamed protein product [Phaedon cochleariae]|uniref:acid phosphatase n=1 Tax=Phaedon cochleariae TaxID=80249 RepID=A0A9N9SA62_PHACE|nr:unnamed protein product [Phaedon cochleariae]
MFFQRIVVSLLSTYFLTTKIMVFIFVFLIGLLCFEASATEDELLAVVVIYRHGDRTPVKPYPTDPYRNQSYWPVDFGQLTNLGKERQLELGQWLRKRYDGFLSSNYSEKDIYVRSTDVDRTLMSAAANLAGLYPPVSNQVWDKNINWQPIPIHTTPEIQDALLAGKKPCPKYEKLQKLLFRSEYFRNISHQNHDLYAYLTRYSGETISNLETTEYLYNTLMIETIYNYTLPEWATKVFPRKLEPLAFLSFATQTFTPQLARLKTGPLFNHIISFFQNRTTKVSDTPKFLVFSAHDTTIANVLNTMGAFQYHAPPYASSILMELRKRNNGRNYVNLLYKNSSAPKEINLKNCDFNCDLANFISILKPITIDLKEWEVECQPKWTSGWPIDFQWNIIIGCSIFTMILLAFGLVLSLKKSKQQKENDYVKLPNEEYS